MPSLEIKNLPERILKNLQEEAAVAHRDIGEVAAERLARSFAGQALPVERDAQKLLKLADAVRAGDREAWFTPEFIRRAREESRA